MLRIPSFVVAGVSTVLVVACSTQSSPTAPFTPLSSVSEGTAVSEGRNPIVGLPAPRAVSHTCPNDVTGPSIAGLSATPNTLWPPNHKWNDITVSYTATDPCAPVVCRLLVTSDEPENALGDGNTAPDIEVQGAQSVRLRAERSGTQNGRVYTITVECRDGAGNVSTSSTTVTVAHDQRKK